MQSARPKVLHTLGGTSLLQRVVNTAQALHPEQIHVVIGHAADLIREECALLPVQWVLQTQQLGTGHAVMQTLPYLPDDCDVLILSADVPLIHAQLLQQLVTEPAGLRLLLATVTDPTGLGRIIRNAQGQISAIVEEKDATPTQRQIHEIYTGICCAKAQDLKRWMPQLTTQNQQKEYYLTDIIRLAVAEQTPPVGISTTEAMSVCGVNTRAQLAALERAWQLTQAQALLHAGVTLADPARIDIRGEVQCARDVFIDINAVLTGVVIIGEGCIIGPNCTLTNVTLHPHCRIHANSVLDGCVIGEQSEIGPFARIRPGTQLAAHCKIGNFVETKQASFGEGSKASHLSYLGDVTIGCQVNIGAGTITCNYDGANKHQTVIEDGAFIGSDTQLVAPVTIGANATIGAGSTIRKSAPPNQLTLTVSTQKSVPGWVRPPKKT
jgi:bifunctional UDP-N-acetylglucosamine pyrophosphorylase/glucosamine-1-phosphate N-acetyltransferase